MIINAFVINKTCFYLLKDWNNHSCRLEDQYANLKKNTGKNCIGANKMELEKKNGFQCEEFSKKNEKDKKKRGIFHLEESILFISFFFFLFSQRLRLYIVAEEVAEGGHLGNFLIKKNILCKSL
jgi:hypothetical protein